MSDTGNTGVEGGGLSADILAHVKQYGVKEGDPRRVYTQCQLEMAVRLSVKALPSGREETDGPRS